MTTSYKVPTDKELRDQVVTFLRIQNRYKKLKDAGDLEETINLKIEATKDLAANLIASGVFVNQAWPWAIRGAILELEPD